MSFHSFLSSNDFSLIHKVSKGHSSEVFLAKHLPSGKLFALKAEKAKSRRVNMLEKEVANLMLANSVQVGPKLYAFDRQEKIVVMEFIDGIPFKKWIEGNPERKNLRNVLEKLLEQAVKLDEACLDHGQLAGRGTNILVRKKGKCFEPVIVDFEKASQVRKPHNKTQLEGFLFKNPKGFVAGRIKEILGESKNSLLFS